MWKSIPIPMTYLDKVDDKKMGFMPAVELSYIKPKNQRLIAVSIDGSVMKFLNCQKTSDSSCGKESK